MSSQPKLSSSVQDFIGMHKAVQKALEKWWEEEKKTNDSEVFEGFLFDPWSKTIEIIVGHYNHDYSNGIGFEYYPLKEVMPVIEHAVELYLFEKKVEVKPLKQSVKAIRKV